MRSPRNLVAEDLGAKARAFQADKRPGWAPGFGRRAAGTARDAGLVKGLQKPKPATKRRPAAHWFKPN